MIGHDSVVLILVRQSKERRTTNLNELNRTETGQLKIPRGERESDF